MFALAAKGAAIRTCSRRGMRVQLKHDAGIKGAAVSMEFSFSCRTSTAYPRLFTSFSPKVKRDTILVTKKS